MTLTVQTVFETLKAKYDDNEWWPSESIFEVMVGAILTQRVSWKNVEMAIGNLERAHALDPRTIMTLDGPRLEELIRPSGFYRQKSRCLKMFCAYLLEQYDGDFELMKAERTDQLRAEMLSLNGIGRETADTILLYALGHPSFIADAYSLRLFGRLGIDIGRSYDLVKSEVEDAIGKDVRKLSLAHAMIVTHCKAYCLAIQKCRGCPFSGDCPSEVHDG